MNLINFKSRKTRTVSAPLSETVNEILEQKQPRNMKIARKYYRRMEREARGYQPGMLKL